MDLKKALRIQDQSRVALVGAGGKTTILFCLARELSEAAIVTASTHLAVDQTKFADTHIIINSIEEINILQNYTFSGVTLLTGPVDRDRILGLPYEFLNVVHQYCQDHDLGLIMEADGSRRLPMKAPRPHEPPIPSFIDTVVVVSGLSALGEPLTSDWVYNPKGFAELAGLSLGEVITTGALTKVLTHESGGLKNIPMGARRIALLNQADTFIQQVVTDKLAQPLLEVYDAVVVTWFPDPGKGKNGDILKPLIHAVHEPVAGIILAAGESCRLGEPKQLLLWRGKPLIWHASQVALNSGLDPVLVVLGAYADEIKAVLEGLDITIIYNQDWQLGQGSSVSTAIKNLPPGCGSALFFLADQPFIPGKLVHRLVETHAKYLDPIVLPWVNDQPANPVLFDRGLFTELSELSGDVGGRSLFSKYGLSKVFWNDSSVIFDVDTLEDYQRLSTWDDVNE